MQPSTVPAAQSRRTRRIILWLLLPGFLVVLAGWSWSAYHLSLAERAAAAHDDELAWQHLEQARLTWPVRADTHLLAARLARRLGKTSLAHAHLEAHDQLGGDRDARALELTLLQVQDGEDDWQEKHLLDLVRDNHPQSGDILEAMARGSLRKNQPGGLAPLLELWPDHLSTSCWRGKVHFYLGEYDKAVADLAPFVAQDPDWDELRLEFAKACFRIGRTAESLAHLRHLRQRNPSSADILLELGMCLQDQAQLDEAATTLDSLLEQDPHHRAGLVERGRVAFRQGQPGLGERHARQAIADDGAAPDAYLILALCLEAQGRQQEAKDQWRRWQALDAAHYHLRQILPELGRFPDDPQRHFEAGSIFLLLGNQKTAIEVLGRVLRVDPNHRSAHRLLAEYYEGVGELERAKEHRRAASP